MPALVCAMAAVPLALTFEPSPLEAKAPGVSHCYRRVCHHVRTVEQTRRMIGRTFVVETSYYDLPGVDRFNTGTYTSNGERFDANDPARVASADLPDGTELLLRNPINGRVSHVRVNDFGPFRGNRRLDVTRRVAEDLDFRHKGVVRLDVIVIAAPEEDDLTYRRNRERRATRGHLGVVFENEMPALVSGLLVSGLVADRQPATEAGTVVASLDTSPADTIEFGNNSEPDETTVAEPTRSEEVPFSHIAYSEPVEPPSEATTSSEAGVELFAAAPETADGIAPALAPELKGLGNRPAAPVETYPFAVAQTDQPEPQVSQLATGGSEPAPASASATAGLQIAGFVSAAAAASDSGRTALPTTTSRNLIAALLAALLSALLAASLARQRWSDRATVARQANPMRTPRLSSGFAAGKAATAAIGPPVEADVTVRVAQPATARQEHAVTQIAGDLHIEGAMRSAGRVEIAGRFTGRIEADELVVLPGGVLSGDAICRIVDVAGEFTGAISAHEVLIRDTGRVDASIETALITVDAAAHLEGQIRRRRMA